MFLKEMDNMLNMENKLPSGLLTGPTGRTCFWKICSQRSLLLRTRKEKTEDRP